MSFASIDALRESLAGPPHKERSQEYTARMLHEVPDAPVVDRVKFILGRCAGKVVLDVGASGPLHEAVCKVASKCYGIDHPEKMAAVGNSAVLAAEVHRMDLDEIGGVIPLHAGVELVVCGEVLEHLSNPGHFLDRLRKAYPGVPVIVTVPNAFSDIGRRNMEKDGTENCNIDHAMWFSWRTLKTLVERAGYRVAEMYWQHGRPLFAEGLIFVME